MGQIMKTYQIELKRVSYVNVTVDAETQDEAEDAAWKELGNGDYKSADWFMESIEEVASC